MNAAVQTDCQAELVFEPDDRFCWIVPDVPSILPNEPSDGPTGTPSRLVVTEDGLPLPVAHAPHEEIRSVGAGQYSHWGTSVRFATSDNSSPITNGRMYELVAGDRRVRLGPSPYSVVAAETIELRLRDRREQVSTVDRWLQHAGGFRWRLDVRELCRHYGLPAEPGAGDVVVREDNRRLTPTLDWPWIDFAASDNSNPKLNGRTYDVELEGRRLTIPRSPQALILGGPTPPVDPALAALIPAAVENGRGIQLDVPNKLDYFRFLAGLLDLRAFTRVLEIGTEYGRSAMSMACGMGTRLETLVTVDIADQPEARRLDGRNGVHRVIGDAMLGPVMQRVLELFDYQPIDVLFVDSGHDYPTTMAHMGTYAALLQPKIVLIDDIVLNEDMAHFWSDVRTLYGARAVNACDVDPRVRSADCGFGMILLK